MQRTEFQAAPSPSGTSKRKGFFMKGKATVLLRKAANSLIPERTIKKVAVQGAFFLLGMLFSQATVLERFSPFSASLVAAAPYPNVFFASLGGMLGFLITGFHLQAALPGGYYRCSSHPVDAERTQTVAQPSAFCTGNSVPSHCHYRVCRAGTWQLYLSKRGYDTMRISIVRRFRLFYDALPALSSR